MPVRGTSLREIVLAACFFILISPKILFAWTTPVNISNTTGHSNYASLAVDRYGNIHVVWTDDTSGNNEVLYCFYNGDYWSAPLNISNDATDSERSDITVDAFGQLHVAWKDHQSGEMYWTFYAGTSWASPVNISNNPGYSTCPSLAADDSGRVFISWHDIREQSDIYFSIYDGTSWSPPQNVTNDPLDSAYPDIAVDSKGCVHLVWMNYGADIEAYYSKYDGISWSSWVNISNLEGYSCDPKIALDSLDRPHVVWEEREHGYEVYYTHFDGEDWTVPYKLSGSDCHNPAITLDSNDNGHVVWGGPGNGIYYTFGSDTSWSSPLDITDSSEVICLLADIGVDSTHLHVVWTKAIDRTRAEIYYSSHKWSGVEPQSWRPFPKGYKLEQCYPNPLNPSTVIRYSLLVDRSAVSYQRSAVSLKIYNILGEEVITLVDQEQRAGRYEVVWDGRNNQGKEVANGVYLCRLKAGEFTAARKMVLLR